MHRWIIKNRIRAILSAFGLATLLPICPCKAATTAPFTSWQQPSRKAYIAYTNGQYSKSLLLYENALSLLRTGEKNLRAEIEMQLNIAQILTRTGKFDRAREVLQTVASDKSRPANGQDLLALRYWHRCYSLHSAQGDFNQSLVDQRRVWLISTKLFDKGSVYCQNEKYRLMQVLLNTGHVIEASQIAVYFFRQIEPNTPKGYKKLYSEWIQEFMDRSDPLTSPLIERKQLRLAYELLKTRLRLSSDKMIDIAKWQELLLRARAQHSPLAEPITRNVLALIESQFQTQPARAFSVYTDICMQMVYAKVYAAEFDAETEQLVEKALWAADQTTPAAKRNQVLYYIQHKAVRAWVLARRGHLTEAEQIVDEIKPDPSQFAEEGPIFNGLFQARIDGLAYEYKLRNDSTGVERQFDKLAASLKPMHRIPLADHERLTNAWALRRTKMCKGMKSSR